MGRVKLQIKMIENTTNRQDILEGDLSEVTTLHEAENLLADPGRNSEQLLQASTVYSIYK
ncbi:hypothetical protein GBA52_015598 [Prunus armeniaca]|nr:hypothetical protein GBA52_015598 [Prunus armeniaca]